LKCLQLKVAFISLARCRILTLPNQHSLQRCRNAMPGSSTPAIPTLTHSLTGPPPRLPMCTRNFWVHLVKQSLELATQDSGDHLFNMTIKSLASNFLDTIINTPRRSLFRVFLGATFNYPYYRIAINSARHGLPPAIVA
jgi:hypothetical protein